MYSLQNLCVTAAHRPIKEILEKEKKVCLTVERIWYDSVYRIIISCIG